MDVVESPSSRMPSFIVERESESSVTILFDENLVKVYKTLDRCCKGDSSISGIG